MDLCESCANYVFDEEYAQYTCAAQLDMDEYAAFIEQRSTRCPYYDPGDEYSIVRKQN